MKKMILMLAPVLFAGVMLPAQQRTLTRGAAEGELYLSAISYTTYGPWGDTMRRAVIRLTENGKKAEKVYECLYADKYDSTKMFPQFLLGDAAEGALYNNDIFEGTYDHSRLWISFDYGRSWELRDTPLIQSSYFVANFEGLIYRSGGGAFNSENYALSWNLIKNAEFPRSCEVYFRECELLSLIGRGFYYTENCFQDYINITIDEEHVFGNIEGHFPDVYRGGVPGEVYISSWFPDRSYKVSFSADTGRTFRTAYHSAAGQTGRELQCMTDRKAGEFYIAGSERIGTSDPRGWYTRICIEHYTDYGETLAGRYCHDLTREGIVTGMERPEEGDEIAVYPNPTSGPVKIQDSKLKIEKIQLFDLFGRQVLETTETTFDTGRLPAGVYLMRIETEKGTVTRKVVKQ